MHKVSDLNLRATDIQWLPNGHEVLVTALPENLTAEQYAKEVVSSPQDKKKEEVQVGGSTVAIYRFAPVVTGTASTSQSDPWSLKNQLRDLALVILQAAM